MGHRLWRSTENVTSLRATGQDSELTVSTPHAAKVHRRPVKPRAWQRLRRSQRSAATTTIYTLLLGERTITTDQVCARVLASAGYRTDLLQTPELRRAASLVDTPTDPDSARRPTVYVADGPTEASTWQRLDDLTIEAYDGAVPVLRFSSRSGQPLSSALHHVVERAELALVIAESNATRSQTISAAGTWRAVVLLPVTG